MSLDPNDLTNSHGLNELQRKSRVAAQNAAKRQAKKAIRRLNKSVLAKKLKGAAKRAALTFAKALFKVLVKGLMAVFSGALSIKLIAFFVFALALIFLGIFFYYGDYGLEGREEPNPEIVALFDKASLGTVDAEREEQLEWRLPTGLISSMTMVRQISRDDDPISGASHYRGQLMNEITSGLEPIFTYEEFPLESQTYTVETCTYEECDDEGNCTTYTVTTTSPVVTFIREVVDKIVGVDTWRGHYDISYRYFWEDWFLVSSGGSGNCTYEDYQRDQQIEEDKREHSKDFNRFIDKVESIGLDGFNLGIVEAFFNETVSDDSPMYTQRNPLDLSYFTGFSGGGRTGMAHGAPIPEEFLEHDYVWPVPTISRITSGYGGRVHPVTGVWSGHRGIDLSIGPGQSGGHNIYAMASGTVTRAGATSGFGQAVYIDHGNGLVTRYGHLQWDAYGVSEGDNVEKGDYIGQIGHGRVGTSTGPHLHFEVIVNGNWVNPLAFVRPPK